MKFSIKTAAILLFLLIFSNKDMSAQNLYDWSIGVGTGYMHYFGDLTPKLGDEVKAHYKFAPNDREFATGVWLSKRTKNGNSFVINYNRGSLTANDLTAVDSTYRNRSLNFYTEVQDLSLTHIFRSDKKGLLGSKGFFAPYFFVGVGVTQFEVFGDLKDEQGNLYTYPEGVPQDGIFETDLDALNVEKDYKNRIMNIPFGVGIRISAGRNWSLNAQTDIKYMFTDYLDDVSGDYRDTYTNSVQAYASQPNPAYTGDGRGKSDGIKNDIYAFTSVSLRYSFGKKKKKNTFIPPIFPPSMNADLSGVEVEMEEDKMEETATEETRSGKKGSKNDDTDASAKSGETGESGEAQGSVAQEDIAAMVQAALEESKAKEAEEAAEMEKEAEEEVQMNESQNGMGQPQGMPNPPANNNYNRGGNGGGGYDPVVEMYKLEVDRLRAEKSDMKIDQLQNQINDLQNMLRGGGNGGNNGYNNNGGGNSGYNNNNGGGNSGYNNNNGSGNLGYNNNNSGGNSGYNNNNNGGGNSGYNNNMGGNNNPNYNNNPNNNQNNSTGNAGGYDVVEDMSGKTAEMEEEKEEKKGLKKIFGKKDKKKNKEDEKDEKEDKNMIEKLGDKLTKTSDDGSVNIDSYQFNFEGETIEVNSKLKKKLKGIAKNAKKSDGKIVFQATTTKANESKTNTIVVKLAQILAEDYGVDASKFTYQIKTAPIAGGSTDTNQLVTIQIIK